MNTLLTILLGIIGGPELIIVAIIILVLFGGRKIPELMRGLGKGVKEFKDASNDGTDSTETFDKEQEDSEDSVKGKSDKNKKS